MDYDSFAYYGMTYVLTFCFHAFFFSTQVNKQKSIFIYTSDRPWDGDLISFP